MALPAEKYLDMAEKLIELALDLAPVEVLRERLDVVAARRTRAIAEALLDAKFAGKP